MFFSNGILERSYDSGETQEAHLAPMCLSPPDIQLQSGNESGPGTSMESWNGEARELTDLCFSIAGPRYSVCVGGGGGAGGAGMAHKKTSDITTQQLLHNRITKTKKTAFFKYVFISIIKC